MKSLQLKIYVFTFIFFLINLSCERNELAPSKIDLIEINNQNQISDLSVSLEEANDFAINFLKNRTKFKSTLSIKGTKEISIPIKDRKLFLVQFEQGGFVLMSDNMRNIPVLAFSESGDFGYSNYNELPAGLKEWISETILLNYELERDTALQNRNELLSEWQSNLPELKSTNIIDPEECKSTFLGHSKDIYDDCMLQTHWSQDLPYSLYTPICNSSGAHKPTGCVATAVAQVMNFWESPNSYNWSILLNSYSPSSRTTSAYEVASLMKDIGSKVFMIYGCEGSSSSNILAKNALKNNFGYNSSINFENYNIDKIRQNLQWGYPVILGGYRTKTDVAGTTWYTNGHTWVCDGLWAEYDNFKVVCTTAGGVPLESYETRNYRFYLHMNWGWGNYSLEDTWYFSNNLTHPIGTDKDYQWNKDMIINIHP